MAATCQLPVTTSGELCGVTAIGRCTQACGRAFCHSHQWTRLLCRACGSQSEEARVAATPMCEIAACRTLSVTRCTSCKRAMCASHQASRLGFLDSAEQYPEYKPLGICLECEQAPTRQWEALRDRVPEFIQTVLRVRPLGPSAKPLNLWERTGRNRFSPYEHLGVGWKIGSTEHTGSRGRADIPYSYSDVHVLTEQGWVGVLGQSEDGRDLLMSTNLFKPND